MNIPKEVVELFKSAVAAGTFPKQGLSQEHWTAHVRDAICETIFTDYSKESMEGAEEQPKDPEAVVAGVLYKEQIKKVRAELYSLLYVLGNISAVRQKYETAGILHKSEGGRKSADAQALADRYA